MLNFLLISGSPRKGNTDFILQKLFSLLKGNKTLVRLRDKNIKSCSGCLKCNVSEKCFISDDMKDLYKQMLKADVFIVGSPNYFNNVSGLLKNFIDRTTVFYETKMLQGKKLFNIVVGAGKISETRKVVKGPLTYFAKAHQIEIIDSFYWQALGPKDIESNPEFLGSIDKASEKINLITDPCFKNICRDGDLLKICAES